MTMTPSTNALSNGHGQVVTHPEAGLAPVLVPETAQAKLKLLIEAKNKSQAALALYFKSLMVVLDLPEGTDWDLSDDLAVLTPHSDSISSLNPSSGRITPAATDTETPYTGG